MMGNYFKITIRNLRANKMFTLINLIGLSTGMACATLIFLWVTDELRVDRFHEYADRLYQVMEHSHNPISPNVGAHTSGLLAEALAEQLPEVEHAVAAKIRPESKILSVDEQEIRATVQYAGPDFFRIFSYELIHGNKDQVLLAKNAVVISETLAMSLFHSVDDVVGKTVMFQQDESLQVAGVFKTVPTISSAQFDAVLSLEAYIEANPNVSRWDYNTVQTYLLLKQGTDIEQFNRKIANFQKDKTDPSFSKYITIAAHRYADNYLYGNYEQGKQVGGRITYVRLFIIVAAFILVIACINFMNLSTAKASRRLKEVGVKKAIGAPRATLVRQYIGESMLMAFASLIIALLVVLVLLPQFNVLTGKQLTLAIDPLLIGGILGITVLAGLLAGSYPALYLSGFSPIAILKGKIAHTAGELWTRKGLVVFQFTLSVTLIIVVLVVYSQLDYIQTKHLGYDKQHVVSFDIEGKVQENLETFLSEVRRIPGIVNASSIGQSIVGGRQNSWTIDEWEGKPPDERIIFEMRPVNYGMIELLGVDMAEGRMFSEDYGSEDSKIIFNEAAIKAMGLKNPVGKTIGIQGTQLQIIGVVRDFHFASFHEQVSPLFFVLQPTWTHKLMAKIEAGRERETLTQLQNLYNTFNPGFPMEYQFLDDAYQAQYVAEQRVSIMSRYFAVLTVMISCLGLFGLAAFTAEKRVKEISVRKVLGAKVSQIVRLLSTDFIKLVLVSIVIASPLAWWGMNRWLDGFAYRVEIQWWMFVLSGFAAIAIAMLTVGWQAIRAAVANPVNSLRDE
ncbi:ABC transporter permease [Olivibacter sitiensis]|uniref:ABC transporter permease n=1 Tax=Olivibacter sitiensis TaxID=376470 RepID=UPI00041C13AD|nr:ABC transporter permease [Olivibacter sitiensis]